MDKPRHCPKCAASLEVAPLKFTLAYRCARPSCGLVLCRAQDAERVMDDLAALGEAGPLLELPRAA